MSRLVDMKQLVATSGSSAPREDQGPEVVRLEQDARAPRCPARSSESGAWLSKAQCQSRPWPAIATRLHQERLCRLRVSMRRSKAQPRACGSSQSRLGSSSKSMKTPHAGSLVAAANRSRLSDLQRLLEQVGDVPKVRPHEALAVRVRCFAKSDSMTEERESQACSWRCAASLLSLREAKPLSPSAFAGTFLGFKVWALGSEGL